MINLFAKRGVVVGMLAAAALTLVACAPDHGTVEDRRDIAAHYHDWTSWQCIVHNKQGACTVNMPVHHHDYVAEQWQLKLNDGKDTGWHTVTQDSYEHCPVDSTYPACKHKVA